MSQGFGFYRLRQRGPSQYAFGTEEPTGIIMQNAYVPPWCVEGVEAVKKIQIRAKLLGGEASLMVFWMDQWFSAVMSQSTYVIIIF